MTDFQFYTLIVAVVFSGGVAANNQRGATVCAGLSIIYSSLATAAWIAQQ